MIDTPYSTPIAINPRRMLTGGKLGDQNKNVKSNRNGKATVAAKFDDSQTTIIRLSRSKSSHSCLISDHLSAIICTGREYKPQLPT